MGQITLHLKTSAPTAWRNWQGEALAILQKHWSEPQDAIEGTYFDKKFSFSANVSIRGWILSGVMTKLKMQRTTVVYQDYLYYNQNYNCFKKCHKSMSVYLSPCFRDGKIEDVVTVGVSP